MKHLLRGPRYHQITKFNFVANHSVAQGGGMLSEIGVDID